LCGYGVCSFFLRYRVFCSWSFTWQDPPFVWAFFVRRPKPVPRPTSPVVFGSPSLSPTGVFFFTGRFSNPPDPCFPPPSWLPRPFLSSRPHVLYVPSASVIPWSTSLRFRPFFGPESIPLARSLPPMVLRRPPRPFSTPPPLPTAGFPATPPHGPPLSQPVFFFAVRILGQPLVILFFFWQIFYETIRVGVFSVLSFRTPATLRGRSTSKLSVVFP